MERIFEEAKRHEPWSSNLATFIRTKEKAPHFRAPENASDEEVIESYIQHHVENLSWLYEQVPIEIRDRTKNWYPGVNKAIKDVWMPRYEKTDAQIAGVIAVLSPQNEWGNNTSQAKRVLDISTDHQDSKWSPEMSGTAARLVKGDKNLQALGLTEGKSLREVEGNFEKAIWIRIYDETYNAQTSASRVLLTPEGTWEEASAYAAKEIEALRSVLVPGETVTPGFDPVFKFEERTKKEGAIMELSEQVVDELKRIGQRRQLVLNVATQPYEAADAKPEDVKALYEGVMARISDDKGRTIRYLNDAGIRHRVEARTLDSLNHPASGISSIFIKDIGETPRSSASAVGTVPAASK